MNSKPSLYNYLNYRTYLTDFFDWKRSRQPGYSQRVFAKAAGYSSSGYFSEVIHSKRNLSESYLKKFSKALSLDEKEEKFFRILVHYTDCQSKEEKGGLFEELVSLLPITIRKLRESQRDYFSKWYLIAVRESLSLGCFKEDYEEIAKTISPPILPEQAKEAVEKLLEIQIIRHDQKGYLRACDPNVEAQGGDASGYFLKEYHLQMMELAGKAMDQYQSHERNFAGMSMSLSQDGWARVDERLKEFQKELVQIAQSDSGEDRVCQVNFQMFPIARLRDEK